MRCKVSSWSCVYHACMSDDCQWAQMVAEYGCEFDLGPGDCEYEKTGRCPKCRADLQPGSGCVICPNCGWSPCDN